MVREISEAFVAAAERSVKAGFKVIELHFAHGYLGHSFLSPLMNDRTDGYGGPFDHRVTFLIDTARFVRRALPDDIPLLVRLSCTDWVEGGWTIEDSVEAAQLLKREGVDLIERASRLNVNIPDYYYGVMGNAYRMVGRTDEAIHALQTYHRLQPGFGLGDLVLTYARIGETDRARQTA